MTTSRHSTIRYRGLGPTEREVRARPSERGFTIVEVLIASLILVVGLLSLVGLVDAANGATASNNQREAATNLAREVIENVGTIAYDDVTPSGVIAALQARAGLADSSANSGYTIERRDVTMNVDVAVCSLDDAADGLGVHTTGSDGVPFCSGGATGAADSKPADYRRVTTTLTWTFDGETKTVRQSSFVMPPSGSDLPVVTTLTASPTSPITNSAVEQVDFSATTSSVPAGVTWSQDGTQMGEATGSETNWNFTWPIGTAAGGLVDGDYVIGARGRTGGGSNGPLHNFTVKLNRSVPSQPQGFVAGKNGSSVDAEWLANSERDISGYTVYRQQTAPTTGTATQVNCGTVGSPVYITTSLTCTDASPITPVLGLPSYVGTTESTSETSTISVSRPTYSTTNDVLVASIVSTTGSAITAPAGWTPIGDTASSTDAAGIRSASYYRVIPSGTEASSYTWNVGAARSTSASIVAARGIDTTAPIDVTGQQTSGTTNGATETAPSVTTTGANRGVLRVFGHRGTTASTSRTLSDVSGHSVLSSTASQFSALNSQSFLKTTAGATGSAMSTCSSNCNSRWVARTIAFRPASTVRANYWVKAVDLDASGNYREGAASTAVAAYATNTTPTAPGGLSGSAEADGSNVLIWTSQGADEDSGDSVAFYRVYRNGVAVDRTASGTDTTWTDPNPGSGSFTYYLKAVDTRLAESPASNSVTVPLP